MLRGLAILALAAVAAAQSEKTVWDGVYTSPQAARGEEAFGVYCVNCHRGGFRGAPFMKSWGQDKLSSLYNFIRTSMPVGSPGVATQGEYLDIVAFVLSTNNFPAGEQELAVKDLENIRVVGKDGPAAVPDGALIHAAGCLKQGSDHAWTLARSTGPVRTRDVEASTGPELKAVAAEPLGDLTFRLPDVGFYHPERHQDHKVEIKGFLDRQPKGDRIMVTSLQTLASNCTE